MFFFDRSVGITIPRVLQLLKLPIGIEYHDSLFAPDELDDVWLPIVGAKGWVIIGHDSKYHLMESELHALKDYQIGCFCLWGAQETRWQKMRVFALAYDRILRAVDTTSRPFVYDIDRRGRLTPIYLS